MRSMAEIERELETFDRNKRAAIKAFVQRHVDACFRNGVDIGPMSIVWVEAIDLVERGFQIETEKEEYLSTWRYPQYVTPTGSEL